MVFGLPVDSWLLLIVAVGLGLSLELLFWRAQRGARGGPGRGSAIDGRADAP